MWLLQYSMLFFPQVDIMTSTDLIVLAKLTRSSLLVIVADQSWGRNTVSGDALLVSQYFYKGHFNNNKFQN